MAVDMASITDWLLTEEVEEQFRHEACCTPGIRLPAQDTDQREYGRTLLLQVPSGRTPQDRPRERRTLLHRGTSPADLRAFLANIRHIVKVKHIEKIKGRREEPASAPTWSVSWLKGTNNRKQPPLPENYFKMIVVEVFTAVSRCSFATVNTGTPPKMYNQLKHHQYE